MNKNYIEEVLKEWDKLPMGTSLDVEHKFLRESLEAAYSEGEERIIRLVEAAKRGTPVEDDRQSQFAHRALGAILEAAKSNN